MASLVLASARLYIEFRRLTLTGSRVAARRLIDALGSPSENTRTLAYMFLVRAGDRSLPELLKAIDRRHPQLPACLTILGDIGGEIAKATLPRFVGDADPNVARAAADGLSTIAMNEKLDRGESPFTLDPEAR